MTATSIIPLKFDAVKLPEFTEQRNCDWVKYGKDNKFPELLIDYANRSALHNAIITSKVDYAFAKGLDVESKGENEELVIWRQSPNGLGETLNDIYRKCLYDYVVFGGYALNVIWNRTCNGIAQIYHMPFEKIRSGVKDDFGIVREYYYADNWSKARDPKRIDAFDSTRTEGSQLLYCKEYRCGAFYYPLPSYVGALNYIAIDKETSTYHLSHLQNGMSPNFAICINTPSLPEEQKKTKEAITKEYCGAENAGKFFLMFSEDAAHAPTLMNLSADNLGDQFIQLNNMVLQNILSGHRVVSPLLVGIKTEGQLGGNSELETAFTIFSNTVIKPLQDEVVGTLNRIVRYLPCWKGEVLKPTSATPVEFTWSENVMSQIMTREEMREKIGLDANTEEEAI